MAPVNDNPPKASAASLPDLRQAGGYPPTSRSVPSAARDVDLQRWLTGRYAIPVVEEDRGLEGGESEDER